MSGWLIALTGLAYAVVAVEQFVKGAPAMAVVYAAYAVANAGLWALAK